VAVLLTRPAPLWMEITVPVVFIFAPPVVPVTLKLKVHDAPAESVAPLMLGFDVPSVAAIVPPPHTPVTPFGVLVTRPAGKGSGNVTPVSDRLMLGLVMVKLREVDPFSGILAAPKVIVIVGAVATIRFAVAVFPVPPFVDVTGPVVFVKSPATAPVTTMLTWH